MSRVHNDPRSKRKKICCLKWCPGIRNSRKIRQLLVNLFPHLQMLYPCPDNKMYSFVCKQCTNRYGNISLQSLTTLPYQRHMSCYTAAIKGEYNMHDAKTRTAISLVKQFRSLTKINMNIYIKSIDSAPEPIRAGRRAARVSRVLIQETTEILGFPSTS